MESSLSRRFSNYTLETNQPEHCFLISRTKQWCMVWRTPEVTSPSANPPRRLFKSRHPLLPSPHLPDQTNWFPSDHRCTPAWAKRAAVCIHVAQSQWTQWRCARKGVIAWLLKWMCVWASIVVCRQKGGHLIHSNQGYSSSMRAIH